MRTSKGNSRGNSRTNDVNIKYCVLDMGTVSDMGELVINKRDAKTKHRRTVLELYGSG